MSILSKALVTTVIATASVGVFAGELYDPTAGQPTSTISQTGITLADAPYIVIDDNQIVFAANPAYVGAQPAAVGVAGLNALSDQERHDLYSNS